MKFNTVIKLPDGRIGTICWNYLDGAGGVWGRHTFEMPDGGFGDLPAPDFMLREKRSGNVNLEDLLHRSGHKDTMECVGESYEVLE